MKHFLTIWLVLFFASGTAFSAGITNSLEDINVSSLPDNRVQIELVLSKPTSVPFSFTIDDPSRIALDFPNTRNNVKKKKKKINAGAVHYAQVVESKGRTRVVINLSEMVPYEISVHDNRAYITLGEKAGHGTNTPQIIPHLGKTSNLSHTANTHNNTIRNIDFHRGTSSEGRITVSLSNNKVPINMQKNGKYAYC